MDVEDYSLLDYSIMEHTPITRSFAIEQAVLGFLIEGSAHGYELRRRLADGLGALWRIASSQLYNVLARLEAGGMIRSRREQPKGRPARRVYTVTAKGKGAFWTWATSPVRHLRDVRVEFLAKIYFLRRLAPERIEPLILAETCALESLVERLTSRERIGSDDPRFGELALSFRVNQLRGAIGWLRHLSGGPSTEAKEDR